MNHVRVGIGWVVLGLLANVAHAEGWSGFSAAFPLFPCQDGWMGCVVYEQHVDPELRRDTAGRAIPSDARIGWFDLQATPAFSPFAGLSRYAAGPLVMSENEGADAIADAGNVPAPPPRAVEDEASRLARERTQREAREAETARRAAESNAQAQRTQEAAAKKAADDATRRAANAQSAEKAQLEREARDAQAKAAQVEKSRREAEAAASAKQAAADKSRLAAEAAATAASEKARIDALRAAEVAAQQQQEDDRRRAAEAATAAAAAGPSGDCVDLAKLEPFAALGKLGPDIEKCLESRLVNAPKMTDKKKISGILMADAWAKGDKERWETLIKRHLDEIDQSDPDLCYKYALQLSRMGPGRASGVIRWANVALENRMVWIGDQYTSRVFSLYKVRAAASQALWQSAETDHASSPSEDSRDKVDKYRNMTKVNAREWYEYAKSSGKDASTALQLCMSAAGTADYCEAS